MSPRNSLTTIPDPDQVPDIDTWVELGAKEQKTISEKYLPLGIVLELEPVGNSGALITKMVRLPKANSTGIDGYEVYFSNGYKQLYPTGCHRLTGNEWEYLVGVDYKFTVDDEANVLLNNQEGVIPMRYRVRKSEDVFPAGPEYQVVSAGSDAQIEGTVDGKKVVGFTARSLGRSKYNIACEDNIGFGNNRVVVADGIGSRYHSELASHLVVESLLGDPNIDLETSVDCTRSNLDFYNTYLQKWVGDSLVPDSVFVAAQIHGDTLELSHTGDSKWRLYSGDKVLASSKDFSYVQLLVDSGKISEKEAITHSDRNVVLSTTLGGMVGYRKIKNVPKGAVLVLQTDGLDSIPEEEMIALLSSSNGDSNMVLAELKKRVTERNNQYSMPANYMENGVRKLDYFHVAPCDNVGVVLVYF